MSTREYTVPYIAWERFLSGLDILILTNPAKVAPKMFDGEYGSQMITLRAFAWLGIVGPNRRITDKGRTAIQSRSHFKEYCIAVVAADVPVNWHSWKKTVKDTETIFEVKLRLAQEYFLMNLIREAHGKVPNGAQPTTQCRRIKTPKLDKLLLEKGEQKELFTDPVVLPGLSEPSPLQGAPLEEALKEPAPETIRVNKGDVVRRHNSPILQGVMEKFPSDGDTWSVEKVDSFINLLRDAMVLEYT